MFHAEFSGTFTVYLQTSTWLALMVSHSVPLSPQLTITCKVQSRVVYQRVCINRVINPKPGHSGTHVTVYKKRLCLFPVYIFLQLCFCFGNICKYCKGHDSWDFRHLTISHPNMETQVNGALLTAGESFYLARPRFLLSVEVMKKLTECSSLLIASVATTEIYIFQFFKSKCQFFTFRMSFPYIYITLY